MVVDEEGPEDGLQCLASIGEHGDVEFTQVINGIIVAPKVLAEVCPGWDSCDNVCVRLREEPDTGINRGGGNSPLGRVQDGLCGINLRSIDDAEVLAQPGSLFSAAEAVGQGEETGVDIHAGTEMSVVWSFQLTGILVPGIDPGWVLWDQAKDWRTVWG